MQYISLRGVRLITKSSQFWFCKRYKKQNWFRGITEILFELSNCWIRIVVSKSFWISSHLVVCRICTSYFWMQHTENPPHIWVHFVWKKYNLILFHSTKPGLQKLNHKFRSTNIFSMPPMKSTILPTYPSDMPLLSSRKQKMFQDLSKQMIHNLPGDIPWPSSKKQSIYPPRSDWSNTEKKQLIVVFWRKTINLNIHTYNIPST